MSKEQALKLVKNLADASITAYAVVNGYKRGKMNTAADRENKAARAILEALTDEEIAESEIDHIIS